MNFTLRNLLVLVLLHTLAVSSINGMNPERLGPCKKMSKKELIRSIKGLPHELKWYIVSLLLESSIDWNFQLYKSIDVIQSPPGSGMCPTLTCSAAFSCGGEMFFMGLSAETAGIWNSKTGELLTTLQAPVAPGLPVPRGLIDSVAFSPQGKTVLTVSHDPLAHLWNAKTGEVLTVLKGHTAHICAVVWSPDGKTILTGSHDTTARLWNAKTGELVTTLKGHTEPVFSLAYSPDGKTILTGSGDTTARLWNAKTGELIRTLRGHTEGINSVAFSSDGQTVLTGGQDGIVRLWCSKTGKSVRTLQGHTNCIYQVAFSPDGKSCFIQSQKGVGVWNLKTGKLGILFPGRWLGTFSPDGELYAGALQKRVIGVWNSKTGELLTTLKISSSGHSSLEFSSDGKTLLTGTLEKTACLWKRIYGFSGLTDESKKIVFKQFLQFYPVLQKVSDVPANEAKSEAPSSLGACLGVDIHPRDQKNCTLF